MPTEQPEAKKNTGDRSGRLGGASADFVASLGRKVADAREVLRAVEDEPSAPRARDELRRKLHALGSGARLLRFDAMARVLGEASVVLDRAAKGGTVRPDDSAYLAQVLDDLPALAWGEMPQREARQASDENENARDRDASPLHAQPLPFAALVIGGADLAEALSDDVGGGIRSFEVERTEDAQIAIDVARVFAPDLIIIDAETHAAPELVEALLDDPLTEPVPIVVVGSFTAPEQASRFVALGVTKLLPKPVAPETLRRTCEEILDQREGRTVRLTLGEPTLEQLGDRLADEVRRAIVDSADKPARSVRVPLGEGTEVLGAIWGAIARVQEVITAKTDGAIRFAGGAPEGAIALAPWLHHELPGADRMGGRGRGAAADVKLDRRRVVVADDDPGVTWFISDLLRTAGCEVHEALDGQTALDLAFKVSPELVVSDILMPGLDGFALCRALKRDVALRDTPVILLSWKEDLLQRVRELGASAAAYLKKESDARSILARVREVLRPRARVESRLRGTDEVRGRLDGLTVRSLLELVCAIRKSARVSVRDASFLYEIDIRDGAPRHAARTATDGAHERGERVLARMLGIGAGRFVVGKSEDGVLEDLGGTLAQQLSRPIAAARGALYVTTGARTMNVEHLGIDDVGLADYLRATPEPARGMIRRIAEGASPRQMLVGGDVAPSLLEDVLADLAARGAINAVHGPNGQDLLTPAIASAYDVLEGRVPQRRPSTLPPPPREASPQRSSQPSQPAPSDLIAREIAALTRAPSDDDALEGRLLPAYESLTVSEPPPALASREEEDDEELAPSSLEDAVIRTLSGRSPTKARRISSNPPPIIDPNELRARSSNPPPPPVAMKTETKTDIFSGASPQATHHEERAQPSLPPDAMVPGASSDDMVAVSPGALEMTEPLMHAHTMPLGRLPTPAPASAADGAHRRVHSDRSAPTRPLRVAPQDDADASKTPLSSVAVNEAAHGVPTKSSRLWIATLAFCGFGLLIGWGIHWAQDSGAATPASATAAAAPPPAPPPPPPATIAAPPPGTTAIPTASAAPADSKGTTFGEIPSGTVVPPGQGLLIVTAPPDAPISLDGAQTGRGPRWTAPLTVGKHELRVGAKSRAVEVRAGRATMIDAAQTP